ncbi:pollen-specific leucine-rich repeat extensin-like protein 1 [Homalodisca vitripennis]|uniref:pollen-specific leucine-rich repeat extensin-like protein 1 n=1 Tax=Homalodisca vitripennis TaxID=197043 RepID=UPI001EEAB4B5|nr:pollen-specific leucine-rich repeat extensin-like protein 1 [Homalodisca vitripennis]
MKRARSPLSDNTVRRIVEEDSFGEDSSEADSGSESSSYIDDTDDDPTYEPVLDVNTPSTSRANVGQLLSSSDTDDNENSSVTNPTNRPSGVRHVPRPPVPRPPVPNSGSDTDIGDDEEDWLSSEWFDVKESRPGNESNSDRECGAGDAPQPVNEFFIKLPNRKEKNCSKKYSRFWGLPAYSSEVASPTTYSRSPATHRPIAIQREPRALLTSRGNTPINLSSAPYTTSSPDSGCNPQSPPPGLTRAIAITALSHPPSRPPQSPATLHRLLSTDHRTLHRDTSYACCTTAPLNPDPYVESPVPCPSSRPPSRVLHPPNTHLRLQPRPPPACRVSAIIPYTEPATPVYPSSLNQLANRRPSGTALDPTARSPPVSPPLACHHRNPPPLPPAAVPTPVPLTPALVPTFRPGPTLPLRRPPKPPRAAPRWRSPTARPPRRSPPPRPWHVPGPTTATPHRAPSPTTRYVSGPFTPLGRRAPHARRRLPCR